MVNKSAKTRQLQYFKSLFIAQNFEKLAIFPYLCRPFTKNGDGALFWEMQQYFVKGKFKQHAG